MTAFLAEWGQKAADKWLNLVPLPGLLWTGLLAVGLRLGQRHATNIGLLSDWLNRIAASQASHAPGVILVVAVAVLLVSVGAGMAASGLGSLMLRLWTLPTDIPPMAWIWQWRSRRWQRSMTRATARLKTAIADAQHRKPDQAESAAAAHQIAALQHRRDRIAGTAPTRPTRVGDRFERAAMRIRDHNHLDLDLIWPRLWTVLPDTLRADLTAAQDTHAAAGRLAGWGILYLAVSAIWWPAAPVGITVLAAAALRAPASADVLADLVETACDLHAADLAAALGISAHQTATDIGSAITHQLKAIPTSRRPQQPSSSQDTTNTGASDRFSA